MARAKKEGSFHFLNVQLPDDLLERLTDYSNQSRIPKTAITEMALKEYLDRVYPVKVKSNYPAR